MPDGESGSSATQLKKLWLRAGRARPGAGNRIAAPGQRPFAPVGQADRGRRKEDFYQALASGACALEDRRMFPQNTAARGRK